jgi:CHASE2 domain-containing sensor protein
VDQHLTPAGPLTGALVHANHVDAIIDNRTNTPMSAVAAGALEVLLALVGAAVFTLRSGVVPRIVTVGALCLIVIVSSSLLIPLFGLYLDAALPLLTVLAHSAYEEAHEWEIHRHTDDVEVGGKRAIA